MPVGDGLSAILHAIKADLPGVPDETWLHLERRLRNELGGRPHFIAKQAKRNRLADLEVALTADAMASNAELSHKMGVSVSRVQQLKRLCHP